MLTENDNFEAARAGCTDDVDLLVEIAQAHSDAIAGSRGADLMLRREQAFTADELKQVLEAAVEHEHQELVVGTFSGVVFGYGFVRYEMLSDGTTIARLEHLLVDPEARGVGIGEAMMVLILEGASQRGCIGIDSSALPGDRATKNFFESFGLKARQLVVHRSLTAADTTPASHQPSTDSTV